MITLTYQDFLYHIDRGIELGLKQVSFAVYQTNPYVIEKYIENLIKSIDEECEVVVVCNGSTQEYIDFVKSLLENKFQHQVLFIPEKSLSKARNIGTENATYDKTVHIDTDCVFYKGALKNYYEALEDNLVVDGKVDFLHNSKQSKIVATMRSMGIPGNALCPSIGINKKIKDKIGGYYFDERLTWVEDADFNYRMKKNNIGFYSIEEPTCAHVPLSFKQDLRAAKNYGNGAKIRVHYKMREKGVNFNSDVTRQMKKLGFRYWIYALRWNLAYAKGYYFYKVKEKQKWI